MKEFKRTLFIFRRDLRLEDNTGLIDALEKSEEVIPCFIFNPDQISNNPYRGAPCLQFMLESLEELHEQLKEAGSRLYFFSGKPDEIVQRCFEELKIDHVAAGRDYTPFSIDRDKKTSRVCKKFHADFALADDILLHPPEETLKSDGKPYSVFTPYYRNASRRQVKPVRQNRLCNYFQGSIAFAFDESFMQNIMPAHSRSSKLAVKGGRKAALKVLKGLCDLVGYTEERNFPAIKGTSLLSAYLKFTVLSPREIFHEVVRLFGAHHDLLRSLYWRDFFSGIAFFFPHVFGGAFYKKYDAVKWEKSEESFKKWCEGETGFPIVDAGMRELNTTGYMHNRVRMITASFLTKDMHIDWRWGELYFAKKLIDYDPAVNNGNWQWAASTGCDAQPYFRIFNPWNQQAKFDPDCRYIKKWVPELNALSAKAIHNWQKESCYAPQNHYPEPILDHSIESKKTLERYKAV